MGNPKTEATATLGPMSVLLSLLSLITETLHHPSQAE
jgi:hypothetical protein